MKRMLRVRNLKTGEVASRIDISNSSPREIETITKGMLRNMADDWVVDDIRIEDEEKPAW